MAKKRPRASFTYEDNVREREHLPRYETDNYDDYSKATLPLSSTFLALSVSFLPLLRHLRQPAATIPPIIAHPFLVLAWISLRGIRHIYSGLVPGWSS